MMCSMILRNEGKQRQIYLDIAKGIGIVLVVFGHSYGTGFLAMKIYSMPLFFFLSGITFGTKYRFAGFIKRRIQRLYLPFLAYEFIYLLLSPFFYWLGIVSTYAQTLGEAAGLALHIILFDNVNILLSPVWFVTALFFSQLLMFGIECMIRKIAKDDHQGQILRILFGAVILYTGLWIGSQRLFLILWSYNFEAEIGVFLEATAYGLFGVWFSKREGTGVENEKENHSGSPQKKWIIRIILLLLFIGMIIYERVVRPAADMRNNNYDYWPIAPLFAILGIACVIVLSKMISNKGLCYLGRHSFAIMCLHPLMFKLVGLLQVYVFGYDKEKLSDWQMVSSNPIWLGIAALVGLAIPILLIWGWERVKDKLFLREYRSGRLQ